MIYGLKHDRARSGRFPPSAAPTPCHRDPRTRLTRAAWPGASARWPAGSVPRCRCSSRTPGGGVIVDADGNSLIDFGAGIAVVSVGNAAPRVAARVAEQAARFTHTCFMVTPYEGYVEVCEELARRTPGTYEKRSGAVQLRRGGGRERGEDRPARHRAAGHRRVRPRLPRAHQPHHGAHREEHAVQGQVRPVRGRDLPDADGLPAALARRPRRPAGKTRCPWSSP